MEPVEKAVLERVPLHQDVLLTEARRLLLQQVRVPLLQLRLPQHEQVPDPVPVEPRLRQPWPPVLPEEH